MGRGWLPLPKNPTSTLGPACQEVSLASVEKYTGYGPLSFKALRASVWACRALRGFRCKATRRRSGSGGGGTLDGTMPGVVCMPSSSATALQISSSAQFTVRPVDASHSLCSRPLLIRLTNPTGESADASFNNRPAHIANCRRRLPQRRRNDLFISRTADTFQTHLINTKHFQSRRARSGRLLT